MSKENKERIVVTIAPGLLGRVEAWRAEQVVPPSRSAVVVAALEAFLDEHTEPVTGLEDDEGRGYPRADDDA
jgi:metal-responsive CopG/Arc/MetJ family transcriptional regulator